MVIKHTKRQADLPLYSSVRVKLMLAITAASLTSLTGELSRYTCSHYTWRDITPIHWLTIILGTIVQGVIAWRAFIDGSAQKQKEQLFGNKEV